MSKHLNFWKIVLYLVVGGHGALILIMGAAVPAVLWFEPWYVGIPIVVWIVNLAVLPVRCPLTIVENYIRDKLGKERISGFLSHYLKRLGQRL